MSLGVGAFHRCHQAEWTDDALAKSFGPWGIIGVNLRPPDLQASLADQDGYFCRILRENGTDQHRLVGAVLDTVSVLDAAYDPHRLTLRKALNWATDPRIRLITLTITEKGYCHVPATGLLDAAHPDIVHDLAHPQAPVSAPGFILAAIAARRRAGTPMPVVISCDNVADNGATLQRCVVALAALRDPALADFVRTGVRFLSTMVDRIVPATLDQDITAFAGFAGVEDYGLVVGEPFRMWVIEDKTGASLPRWDLAGALVVDDVAPYEILKMRVLNGIQSNVCQLGLLSGLEFMADVMGRKVFEVFARRVMMEEVLPHLPAVPGIDPQAYVEQSIRRLMNPDLKHGTAQISTDGSRKIRQRLLQPIRAARAAGAPCNGLLLGLAGWMQYASGRNHLGQAITVNDPIAAQSTAIGARAGGDAGALVRGMLDLEEVFGTDLRADLLVVDTLTSLMARLMRQSAEHVVADLAGI
jgi:fructuronate reductase